MLLGANEGRAEHTDVVQIGGGPYKMPIFRSDIIGDTGSELPLLPRRQIGHLAGARQDVVRLPVMLVPKLRLGALFEVDV